MAFVLTQILVVVAVNLLLFLIVGGAFFRGHNQLVTSAETVAESWGHIEAHLQRRYDALLAMSRIVQGYSSHEQAIDALVAKAQAYGQSANLAGRVADSEAIEGAARGFLAHVITISAQFPNLKADVQFQELLRTVTETGSAITQRREEFNRKVQAYNSLLKVFPTKLYAFTLGFEEGRYFGSSVDKTGELPALQFSHGAVASGATAARADFPPLDHRLPQDVSNRRALPVESEAKSEGQSRTARPDESAP